MPLRPYQRDAANQVRWAWQNGHRRVCLVMPTRAGKTKTALAIVHAYIDLDHGRALWITHRDELVRQLDSEEDIDVRLVQGMLARDERPPADVVIIDECHRFRAEEWRRIADHYVATPTLGLTATPQRGDGKPLGDIFDHLVVGATYSQLLRERILVPCETILPPVLRHGLALKPVDAYQRHGEGRPALVYCSTVEQAREAAADFLGAGIAAQVVDGAQSYPLRRETLDRFRCGDLGVLTCVHILTEGVTLSRASCVILARNVQHTGTWLQICGRILGKIDGKNDALIVDLTGCSRAHGYHPTIDREYSLEGEAISGGGESLPALTVCERCGYTYESAAGACERCGYRPPAPTVRIWNVDLERVYRGDKTPPAARQREWERLCEFAQMRQWGLAWAMREWRKLFPGAPEPAVSRETKREEFRRLREIGASKGYKPGWAAYRYRSTFGVWPRGVR